MLAEKKKRPRWVLSDFSRKVVKASDTRKSKDKGRRLGYN